MAAGFSPKGRNSRIFAARPPHAGARRRSPRTSDRGQRIGPAFWRCRARSRRVPCSNFAASVRRKQNSDAARLVRRNFQFHEMTVEIPLAVMAWPHLQCVCRDFTHIRWRLRMIARSLVVACLLCCSFIATVARRNRHRFGLRLRRRKDRERRARQSPRAHRRASHAAVRHHGQGHQQEERPQRHRPHQRSRSVHARPRHRPDAGGGAAARLRRACRRSPSARM